MKGDQKQTTKLHQKAKIKQETVNTKAACDRQ